MTVCLTHECVHTHTLHPQLQLFLQGELECNAKESQWDQDLSIFRKSTPEQPGQTLRLAAALRLVNPFYHAKSSSATFFGDRAGTFVNKNPLCTFHLRRSIAVGQLDLNDRNLSPVMNGPNEPERLPGRKWEPQCSRHIWNQTGLLGRAWLLYYCVFNLKPIFHLTLESLVPGPFMSSTIFSTIWFSKTHCILAGYQVLR